MEVKIINNRPVKIWTNEVEESAMRQIENLTTLPFLYHHLAIMPDVHAGMGAENGGYPPTQNGDIRSLFWLFSLMALQN